MPAAFFVVNAKKGPKTESSWGDVKAKLAAMDRVGLIALLRDLYTLNKTSQLFLHGRFSLGADALAACKKRI